MTKIITDSGQELTKPSDILLEQRKFFKNLYKSDENVNFKYKNTTRVRVSDEIRESMEGKFTMEELTKALKESKRNKAPSCDGLTTEFYVMFFTVIKTELLAAINAAYDCNKLHDSALRGVISLIPKSNSDSRKIKSFRPITLLNGDYKLIEKMMANRLKPALEQIIEEDQKAYMQQRRISMNIRRVLDIVKTADEDDLQMIILSINFQKCFDMIETNALIESLRFFGIGESFIRWTKILYTNSKS